MKEHYEMLGRLFSLLGGFLVALLFLALIVLTLLYAWRRIQASTIKLKLGRKVGNVALELLDDKLGKRVTALGLHMTDVPVPPAVHEALKRPLDGHWRGKYCARVLPSYVDDGTMRYLVIMEDGTGEAPLEAKYMTAEELKALEIDVEKTTMLDFTQELVHAQQPRNEG